MTGVQTCALPISQLCFLEAHRNYVRKERRQGYPPPQHPHHHPGLPLPPSSSHPHCCMYDPGMGSCSSPQPPPEYHPPLHRSPSHPHLQGAPEAGGTDPRVGLGMVPGGREGSYLDCPPLEESLDLASLHHDPLTSDPDALGKSKEIGRAHV